MTTLAFSVPGRPVPCARPRTVRTKTGKTVTYTPARVQKYKSAVGFHALAARQRLARWPLNATYRVAIVVTIASGVFGDVDNYGKSVLDGCTRVLWADDKQVVGCNVERVRAKVAGLEVCVEIVS